MKRNDDSYWLMVISYLVETHASFVAVGFSQLSKECFKYFWLLPHYIPRLRPDLEYGIGAVRKVYKRVIVSLSKDGRATKFHMFRKAQHDFVKFSFYFLESPINKYMVTNRVSPE
jgi:hypothetical protein